MEATGGVAAEGLSEGRSKPLAKNEGEVMAARMRIVNVDGVNNSTRVFTANGDEITGITKVEIIIDAAENMTRALLTVDMIEFDVVCEGRVKE